MNVARLELCKELYELSGWADTDKVWSSRVYGGRIGTPVVGPNGKARPRTRTATKWFLVGRNRRQTDTVPAYDLGYLLRKARIAIFPATSDDGWKACYRKLPFPNPPKFPDVYQYCADTPEDAAAKLAIELFKSGVLERES